MAIETPKAFQQNVDITIIGAGPTGLFTALLCRKLGLSVCIVDQAHGPLLVGRADALNARTQQLLNVARVLSELLPQGLKCNTSSTFKDGEFTSRQNHWWTSLQNTQFKEFLMVGQPEVERALINALDCPVLYNTEVKRVEDGLNIATTHCVNLVLKSRYIVAADGAHSFTRKKLGIQFQGEKPNMRWAVLDSFLKTNFPVCDEIISFEKGGQARVAWIPRERGMSRFYILLDGEVTQTKAEDSIRTHMAPYHVKFERTEWFSVFDVQERVAETFVSKDHGRILLAGDAAHVHSVNGGQGLNTGISDAFALVWRLNMACKVMIPGILESYGQERRTTAQGVVDVAAKLVRSTMRTAEEYVAIVEKSAANITGMGITYTSETPFVIPGQVGEFRAGFRCPDFEISQADGRINFFYNLFEYGKFVVLIPSNFKFELDPRASPYVVTWKIFRDDLGEGFKVTTDKEDVLTTRFNLGQRGEEAIIIRPDLYVGYAGVDANDYFKGIFVS